MPLPYVHDNDDLTNLWGLREKDIEYMCHGGWRLSLHSIVINTEWNAS